MKSHVKLMLLFAAMSMLFWILSFNHIQITNKKNFILTPNHLIGKLNTSLKHSNIERITSSHIEYGDKLKIHRNRENASQEMYSIRVLNNEVPTDKEEILMLSWPTRKNMDCPRNTSHKLGSCPLPDGKSCLLHCNKTMYNISELVIFNLFYLEHLQEYPIYSTAFELQLKLCLCSLRKVWNLRRHSGDQITIDLCSNHGAQMHLAATQDRLFLYHAIVHKRATKAIFVAGSFDSPMTGLQKQKWVALMTEPPPGAKHWPVSTVLYNAFNITSFYTQDSTVPLFLPLKSWINHGRLKHLEQEGQNYTETKTKNIVWFVSHCKTQSRREQYVKELSKYIDVTVYGKCGQNISCGNKWNQMPTCAKTLMSDTYRYVLAFENCLCEDYVTEKLKNIFRSPVKIIPIVMGGVNYSHLLPVKTFIDVKNFDSPKNLAKYLHNLVDDSEMYNEYVRRKLAVQLVNQFRKHYMCRLCQHAHAYRDDHEIAPNVAEFGSVRKRCIKPETYIPALKKGKGK